MAILHDTLQEIDKICQNPHNAVRIQLEKTGQKAVGCYLGYTPDELIHSFDILPIGLWGEQIEIAAAKKYYPAFYCAPVQQTLEAGMQGKYDFLSAVLIPALCDTLKTAGQNWKVAVPQIEFIPLVYPHNRKADFAVRFLISEYENILHRLELISGRPFREESLSKSIAIYNDFRRAMREFLLLAVDYSHIITPLVRHQIILASYFQDKSQYTELLKTLTLELSKKQPKTAGKKVILTGMCLDAHAALTAFEENGIQVVADDLLQETRQLRVDVPDGKSGLERLALRWSSMEGCSLLYDPEKLREKMLVELCRKYKADGVVICVTAFCDPEEYDYPLLKNTLKANGIPDLRLEISSDSGAEQIKTRIQAFAELLSER